MVNGTALVSGATGGLGRVMVSVLRVEGRTVIATGRNRVVGECLAAIGARFIPADLAHDDLAHLVAGVDTVFHLAALSSPWGKDQAFVEANVVATERLLKAARAAGCRGFVFTSTPSIYARAADQIGLVEASPLPAGMANAYARTKLAAERIVLEADSAAMRTVALRPRAIIGPHDRVLLPRLLRAAKRRRMPLPRNGRALIEPTDARDVAAALLAAEARLATVGGRVFNISGGVAIALADLVAHVFARLKRQVQPVPVPASLMLAIGTVLEVIGHLRPGAPEPMLTRYGAMTLGWSQTFDLSAARTSLGWAPRHHPLAAIDWALSEMSLA
jgi:nucleoside-diphosphate-sugar epimerase